MSEIAKAYISGELCGWAGSRNPRLVESAFNLLAGEFREFNIFGQTRTTSGRKTFISDVVRAVLGTDLPCYPQETGDCTSFGMKHVIEMLSCCQIAGKALAQAELSVKEYITAARLKWRPVFAPYYYGTSRVYEGGGQLRGQQGSLGSWVFAAAKKYGSLFEDTKDVPRYSGQVANQWGDDKQILDRWRPVAGDYLVTSGAPIRDWDSLCESIHNFYPVTTASNIGYSMEAGRDGFHIQNTTWPHQMMIYGIDQTYREEYGLILNNWGDVHGHLTDFQTGDKIPEGTLRVRRADIEKHLRSGENYSVSHFNGFPEQQLEKALFLLI